MDKELISFIIPCYNSTNTIGKVVAEIKGMLQAKMDQYDYEIILVNDCSPDGTTYAAIQKLSNEDAHIKGINLARNFGQPSAVMAGLNFAKGDFIVCGDDDGQTPFCELPLLFEKIDQGYDVVEAKYIERGGRSLIRKCGTIINDRMATWLVNKPKGVVMTSFWVIRRFVAEEVRKYSNPYPYIGGLLMRTSQKVCNVDVVQRNRIKGESGYNMRKMLSLWLNGFTSFSVKPLRITAFLGMILSVAGFIAGIIIVIRKILRPEILEGYSSIMAIIVFLFGVLFIVLGMIGEYIGRIYISLNNAPQFVIKEMINMEETSKK